MSSLSGVSPAVAGPHDQKHAADANQYRHQHRHFKFRYNDQPNSRGEYLQSISSEGANALIARKFAVPIRTTDEN